MAEDVRKHVLRARREHELLSLDMNGGAQGRKSRNACLGQHARPGHVANLFSVGRTQVAAGDHLSLADENDFIAGDLDFTEQMGIEEDRHTAVALGADDVAYHPPAHRIEPRSRLVQKDQLRLMTEGWASPMRWSMPFEKASRRLSR